ncbi:MAG TPA: hypothetical protein VJ182_05475 [Anaerolineales bacterium]|nr:hypothetical protein [Anaerolineales bacterium]
MAYTVLIHILNEEPIVGEIEELPTSTDTNIRVQNPRKRDGKDLPSLQGDVTTVIWPWNRISFIEVLPSGGEDEIIGFVRE